MFRPFTVGIISIALLTACASSSPLTPTPDFLAYDSAPEVVVIYAKARTFPGGPPDVPFCNEKPALTIWGDGRVVHDTYIGHIESAKMREILSLLNERGFFSQPTIEVNPAGTGFDMTVHLKSGTFKNSWNFNSADDPYPALYMEVLSVIEPDLKPFVPEKALLVAVRYSGSTIDSLLPDEIPEWPKDRFGFSLSEVPENGRQVTGGVLDFVWQAISKSPLVTRFREGDDIYAVSLEIPGIMNPKQTSRCW